MFILGFAFSLTALAWAALATSAASAGVAAYSQRQQGKAAEATGKANAAAARAEAVRQEALTHENMRRSREMNRRYLSTQKAKFAASGVQLRGTPLMVMGQTAGNLELEIFDLAYQASERSRQLEHKAQFNQYEGKTAKRAADISAGASLLKGVTDFAGGYYDWQQEKPKKP